MGFFSKFFKKKLKEETRIIVQEESLEFDGETYHALNDMDYNWILAKYLRDAITAGKLKGYKHIIEFINSVKGYSVPDFELPIEDVKSTKEIESLRKIWKRLKYKCTDESLTKYMIN